MINKPIKIIVFSIVVLLIVLRVALPTIIENRVNALLDSNAKVNGVIDDVDIWLLSGRASVEGIIINKADAQIPAPILSAERVAFSISWKDLFSGRLFGDVAVTSPVLNIVDSNEERNSQTGVEIDWRTLLTSFYPFEINRITIEDGEVHFRNFNSEPPVDLYLESLQAEAINITNELKIEDSQAAKLTLSSKTIGNGQVNIDAAFNLLREPAKGQLELSVVNLDLVSLNDFAKAYAGLDIQAGKLTVETRLEVTESDQLGDLDGSIKPVISNLNVLRWEQDVVKQQDSILTATWEGSVDLVKWLLEVGPKDKVSTSIPVSGSIKDLDIGIFVAILGAVKNAILGTVSTPASETEKPAVTPEE